MKINPNNDGVDHINVYSNGKTELGRMFSNFYRFPIMTKDGYFNSVESYWFWLGISSEYQNRDQLRNLSGYEAKKFGTQLREFYPAKDPDFEDKIIRAIWYKVKRNAFMFKEEYRELPLAHYYVLQNGKIMNVYGKYTFMMEAEERMKKYIYENVLLKRNGD